MEFRRQGHCVYYAQYHLVLVSKYRRKIFNPGMLEYLKDLINRVKDYYPEIDVETVNGEQEHIHLLVWVPPKMPVGHAVGIIKSNTARELKKKFSFLEQVYWGNDGIWSDGYFVSTVGINEDVIRKYIEYQGREDSGQAKLEIG